MSCYKTEPGVAEAGIDPDVPIRGFAVVRRHGEDAQSCPFSRQSQCGASAATAKVARNEKWARSPL
jgi:hypothetical protein